MKLIAQHTYKIEGPGINPGDSVKATTALEKLISNVMGVLTIVAVIWFALQIILAGYSLMTAHGDPKKIEEGWSKLTNGILGIFIVIIAAGLAALLAKLLGLSNPFDLEAFFKSIKL